jgi:hypothetical protein
MIGFTAPRAEKSIELAKPDDEGERIWCTSLQTSVATPYAVQNARGRFGRPGLIAALPIRAEA